MNGMFVGTFRGEDVFFDGVNVICGNFEAAVDCDLNASFRNWLARREIELP